VSVYRNNRGKWCIDIDDFFHGDGRKQPRIRKTSPVQTERGAKQYERDTRQSLLNGTYGQKGPDEVPTLKEYQETFLDVYRGEKRKASGLRDKVSLFKAHLIPLFGDKKLDSFKLVDQHRLRSRFAKLSNTRCNSASSAMNRVIALYYKLSEREGEFFQFEILPVVSKTRPFYDFEHLAQLVAGAREHGATAEVAVLLGADAGLRRSEMFALLARHCDLKRRVLIIEEAEVVINGERHWDDTKGLKARYVDMTARLHAALSRHLAKSKPNARVLVDAKGEPFDNYTFRWELMTPVQELSGLEPTGNVHILRHTFCSHLAIKGVPVLTIKELAGHANISTTLKYMHLAPGEKRRAIDLLETPQAAE